MGLTWPVSAPQTQVLGPEQPEKRLRGRNEGGGLHRSSTRQWLCRDRGHTWVYVCKGGGALGSRDPPQKVSWALSASPSFQAPGGCFALLSSALPHSGAAQAREGCIVGVLKEPAPRKTVQGICPDLSALIQARVTCSPSQPECRAPREEGRCPEFTQQVQVELGTYLGVRSSDS